LPRTLLRFFFLYFLFYCLLSILRFPVSLAFLVVRTTSLPIVPDSWFSQALTYLSYPGVWYQRGVDMVTPWACRTFLGVEVEPPSQFTGSGDGLFQYCSCFAYLVVAAGLAVLWTLGSEVWQRWKTHRAPNYDRLHSLFRLIVSFYLMHQMVVYGAIKVWCGQFPPISDGQLEATYGDSSPMGLLWRFMQFSQPYTAATGIIEFTCGVLLIFRRTTLLGALCATGATLQVFLLNMCYDVPVKLMSGHLLLMALLLIVPDVKRLFAFFVLGRPTAPARDVPLFGRFRLLNAAGFVLRTVLYVSFASLTLYQAYQNARTAGILAPERPAAGQWITTEFTRDGKKVPFPQQPDNAPPRRITPSKWKGGPGLPPVVQVTVSPRNVVLVFEDGSGVNYRNASQDDSEMVLASFQNGMQVAQLRAAFPEPDVMVLEGPVGGEEIRLTLRRPRGQKEYLLKQRGFRWVQEAPFNR
jgi:hypothetical protein